MSQYLLDCECGQQVPVDIRQAGARVTCSCGAQLEVPPLRKMRHLPLVAVEEARPATQWNSRKGVIAGCLILVAALAAVNIWSWATQPKIPVFDPAEHGHLIDENLKKLTPPDAWTLWIDYYRPLAERGFSIFEARNQAAIEGEIAHRQFLRSSLWTVAGILAAIAAAAAFWRGRAVRPQRG